MDPIIVDNPKTLEEARQYIAYLEEKLNSPEIFVFLEAVQREAAHQREKWGPDHDKEKSPEDWLWLIARVVTKATQAERYGEPKKYLHHIITTAACALNWHASAIKIMQEKEENGKA